jgi:hypothetical protein
MRYGAYMDAAKELAEMIADAAACRQQGRPIADRSADASRLIVELSGGGDDGFDRFFSSLGDALRARGATLPPLDELPPGVAPLIAAAADAFVVDERGQIDMQRTADNLDATMERVLGHSPRKAREEALVAEIRREVAENVAASLRRHGLTPACDTPHEDDDDDVTPEG